MARNVAEMDEHTNATSKLDVQLPWEQSTITVVLREFLASMLHAAVT